MATQVTSSVSEKYAPTFLALGSLIAGFMGSQLTQPEPAPVPIAPVKQDHICVELLRENDRLHAENEQLRSVIPNVPVYKPPRPAGDSEQPAPSVPRTK